MITSTQNDKVKWVRSLQAQSRARRKEQVFVVEGVRLAEEAWQAGWEAELVFHTEGLNERGQALAAEFARRGAAVEEVAEHVMRAASDTQSPQGILAVIRARALPVPGNLHFAFVPDGVRDPGNLGTMLRTAAAAGAGAVFLPPGSVDPYSPKVLRAGMGAHFRLPVHPLSWEEIGRYLKRSPMQIYLAAARAGAAYTEVDLRLPTALIVGGEAEGAGEEARRLTDAFVHIPMPGKVESLNAAAAAAILMFEVVRQRQR